MVFFSVVIYKQVSYSSLSVFYVVGHACLKNYFVGRYINRRDFTPLRDGPRSTYDAC